VYLPNLGKNKQIIGASKFILDFRQVAPSRNQSDSNASKIEAGFRASSPCKNQNRG